jgi:hypothetical protein
VIRRYLTLRQIAKAMGRSPSWLYVHLPELVEKHGFPPAAPGQGSRRDEGAVEAWQRKAMPADLCAPVPAPAPNDHEGWAAELDRRAAALGRSDPPEAPNNQGTNPPAAAKVGGNVVKLPRKGKQH